MKVFFSILVGLVLSFFLIIRPLSSRFLALKALTLQIDPATSVAIMIDANSLEECNTTLLDMIGMRALQNKQGAIALWAYGETLKCSPAAGLFRYKYGISLLANGYREGLFFLQEAIRMEPNHPAYRYEYNDYLTKHPEQ